MNFKFIDKIYPDQIILWKLLTKPLVGNIEINKNNFGIYLETKFQENVSELFLNVRKIKLPETEIIQIDLIEFSSVLEQELLLEVLYTNYYKKYSKKTIKQKNILIYILNATPKFKKLIFEWESLNLSKTLGDLDSLDEGTPQGFINTFLKKFKKNNKIKINIIKEKNLRIEKLNLILAVGADSKNKSRLLEMSYTNNSKSEKYIALVGKGVTFDSGGYALKNSSAIRTMRLDKCGAASACAIFDYVVQNNLPINLVMVSPLVENTINQNSILPSQVIISHAGLSVQIDNPDAEGRLILADALSYVQQKYLCFEIICLATLTGAICVTLGKYMTGLFTNNLQQGLKFKRTVDEVGDEVWILPVHTQNLKQIKSAELADLTNSPEKSNHGTSSLAAAFLFQFIKKQTTFLYLDIGGTGIINNRASGVMVRGIIKYLQKKFKGCE